MATNLNWPLVVDSVAFVGDPNDTGVTPTWADLSSRVTEFGCGRGRQYELDQNQAGEMSLKIEDTDEALNPANTGSTYYPNVVPYRQYMRQAMWPPLPVGSAVNLINLSAVTAMDPSFESYTAAAAVSWITPVGSTTPTITATNPQQGTKSLTWTVAGTATVQGVSITVACIPGQQYTASGYIRQTTGSTQGIYVDASAGTTTTTTGSYVRLTKTFTATQPTHTIVWRTSGTAIAGTVNLDAIQLEVGASATTFATTGPVVYPVTRGYIERWPAAWRQSGTKGYTEPTGVDAFAILAGFTLGTEVRNSILTKNPAYYWPLADGSEAITFGEAVANGQALTRFDVPAGPANTFTPGTSTGIAGDPGGTGVLISTPTGFFPPTTILQTGCVDRHFLDLGSVVAGDCAITVALWLSRSATVAGTEGVILFLDYPDSGITPAFFANIDLNPGAKFASEFSLIDDVWADGRPHLYVSVLETTAVSYTWKTYIDGVLVITEPHASTPYITNTHASLQLGGQFASGIGFPGPPDAVYSHLAAWSRALSAAEVADLYAAGSGYAGETSGARVSRYLSYGWSGTTAIDTGASTMGPATITAGTSLLDACQNVTTSENGNFYVSKTGVATFKARTDRYLKTIAAWTLGEQEYPYEDGVSYDFDPSRVANDVKVTRTGGIVAVGGSAADRTTSEKKYFPRSYERTIDVASDLETIDAANWLFNHLKQPVQRISAVTLSPGDGPALWPVALGAEIGDRVTVKRRTSAFTMSSDFFIEKIDHSNTPGSWKTTFELSPAANSNVWILGDATFGVLDSTTILGY